MIMQAAGATQLCAGQESGIEAAPIEEPSEYRHDERDRTRPGAGAQARNQAGVSG